MEVGPGGHRKMPTLTDSRSRALLAAHPTAKLFQSGDTPEYNEVNGVLLLTSKSSQQKHEQPYRSISSSKYDIESPYGSPSASEDGVISDDDNYDTPTITSQQETLKLLEQQLKEEPCSVDKWILLLSHTLSAIPVMSKNASKARAEISISILGRALAADPRNRISNVLRLKYMKAGEQVWHESKIRAEWEDALKTGGIDLWMEWLEWKIGKAEKGVDGIIEDATRVLQTLNQDEPGEIARIRIFWRVAVALQSAGFSERASAMFQAQAELTFNVPQSSHGLPHRALVDGLAEFWEAEVPRVGEADAHGWQAWATSGRKNLSPRRVPVTAENDVTDLDPYRQWAAKELQADRTCLLPARSSDEAEDADPYSTILFSDIQPLLFEIRSLHGKRAYRLAWLSVLGLHIPGFSESLSTSDLDWDDRWSYGHLTRSSCLEALFPGEMMRQQLSTEAVAGVIVGREKEYVSGFGPVRCWGFGVFGPLDNGVEVEGLGDRNGRGGIWGKDDVSGLDEGLIRRVFAQLRLGIDDFEWDTLALAFEAALSVKSSIKQSRSFLAAARDSLPHWTAHALLERMRGRLDDARKVYQTVVIASASGLTSSLLWWDWVEMEWLTGHSDQALNIVLRSVNVDGRSGILLLRGMRKLEAAIEGENMWKQREGWIKLRALLELLTDNGPSAALHVFDKYLPDAKGNGHESLTVACLLMLYHYSVKLRNPMPPSVLRERVRKALEEYPSNSVILGLFLEGEKGRGVWGGVRGILGESGGQTKDVARRIQEVWITGWERGRWASEIERTRSGLAAAVESERTRGSYVVWRIYIELEVRAGQLERAKKLLYRAIGECPLVKELYLVAFGPLRSVFNGRELNEMADAMAARGIRLRVGLEEMTEGWEIEREEKGEMSGSEEEYL